MLTQLYRYDFTMVFYPRKVWASLFWKCLKYWQGMSYLHAYQWSRHFCFYGSSWTNRSGKHKEMCREVKDPRMVMVNFYIWGLIYMVILSFTMVFSIKVPAMLVLNSIKIGFLTLKLREEVVVIFIMYLY